MRYFLAVFFLFFFNKFSYAEFSNFDFSCDSYLYRKDIPQSVSFKYLLSGYEEKDFLIRPLLQNGFIEILNKDTGTWVSSLVLLNSLPTLDKSMKVRISGVELEKTSLSFEIYNTKNGEVYKTPNKDIWSDRVYFDYVNKINSNLFHFALDKEETDGNNTSNMVDTAVISSGDNDNILTKVNSLPRKYFLFFGLGVFCLSVSFGIISFKKKKTLLDGKIH